MAQALQPKVIISLRENLTLPLLNLPLQLQFPRREPFPHPEILRCTINPIKIPPPNLHLHNIFQNPLLGPITTSSNIFTSALSETLQTPPTQPIINQYRIFLVFQKILNPIPSPKVPLLVPLVNHIFHYLSILDHPPTVSRLLFKTTGQAIPLALYWPSDQNIFVGVIVMIFQYPFNDSVF